MEDFVGRFSAWTTECSLFVPVAQTRADLVECGFAILLSSRKPVLAGTCVVLDTFADANNAYGRPGLLLGIKRLGPESEDVFAQLIAASVPRKTHALSSARATRIGMPALTVLPEPRVALATSPAAAQSGPVQALPDRGTQPLRRTDVVRIPPREPDRMPRATPPVVGPSRTMTGEIAADDAAPTHVGPEEKTEPTTIVLSKPPRQMVAEGSTRTEMLETRTPGSPFILPANPLMNLSDESLEGFVDCRLFEATAGFADGSPQLDPPDDDVAAPVEPELVTAPPPPLTPTPPPTVTAIPTVTPTAMRAVIMTATPTAQSLFGAPLAAPRPRSVAAPVVAVGAATLGTVVAVLLWMRSDTEGQRVELPVLAAALSAVESPVTVRVHDAIAAAPAVPTPELVTRSVGSGDCSLRIVVEPVGARITFDGAFVGRAPLLVRGTCAQHRIEVAQPRYRNATHLVTPTRDAAMPVEIALARPTHSVFIKTIPSAAQVKIAGRSFGFTPTYIKVPAFTPVKVDIERPGFKSVVHTVTSKTAADRVTLRLKR